MKGFFRIVGWILGVLTLLLLLWGNKQLKTRDTFEAIEARFKQKNSSARGA